MTRVAANQVVFFLACVGVFIALVTGIAHAAGAELPCGGSGGCDIIARPENSHFLNVPIAFYGLAMYLFVGFMCIFRAAIGLENSPRLGTGMWVMLALGSLVSVGLITKSVTQLHATCHWCVANLVVVVLAFLVHTFGTVKGSTGGKQWPFAGFAVVMTAFVLAGTGYGFMLASKSQPKIVDTVTNEPPPAAYHADDYVIGDPSAPITITEFTDLYCPTCRSQHSWILGALEGAITAGRVKIVVRHYPLPDVHPYAMHAAVIALWAQEQGKFEDFVREAHQIMDKTSEDELYAAVGRAGLDETEAKSLFTDKEKRTPYADALQKDIDDATALLVEATPSWIVDYPSGRRQFSVGSGIQRLVGSSTFQDELRGE